MEKEISVAATVQPITLSEEKQHLRLNSATFAGSISEEQTITPAVQAIAAAYSLEGSGVDVSGTRPLIMLSVGAVSAGATADVKIQDSDDDSTYTDVASGAFTQVTDATPNSIQEKEYTGVKQYIRVVATVAVDTVTFGVNVIKDAGETADDDYLTLCIANATEWVEAYVNRSLITQTWLIYLPGWPCGRTDRIILPRSPLQSITSIVYKDSDGDDNTWDSDEYIVETRGNTAAIVLADGFSFPSASLYPSLPITITAVMGYGDAASDVPENIKQGCKIVAADYFELREEIMLIGFIPKLIPLLNRLLSRYRVL